MKTPSKFLGLLSQPLLTRATARSPHMNFPIVYQQIAHLHQWQPLPTQRCQKLPRFFMSRQWERELLIGISIPPTISESERKMMLGSALTLVHSLCRCHQSQSLLLLSRWSPKAWHPLYCSGQRLLPRLT